jgi:MFS family permease
MRRIGAIVLRAYADKNGRRAGLVLSLSLMSIGILSIACAPGYATIGILASLLVLMGRLLQGFGMIWGPGVTIACYPATKMNTKPACGHAVSQKTKGWIGF